MTADRPSAFVRLLLLSAAVLLLLGAAAPAAATGAPQQGSGTGVVTDLQVLSQRQAGTNSIQERVLTVHVTGALEGELVQHVRGVVHDGRFVTFQGTATFTGTMPGCGEGTLTLGITGKGLPGEPPDRPATDASVRVINQAANEIPARGVGTVQQVGFAMAYELQYVC